MRPFHDRSGATLVEMLVATAIVAIVAVVVASMLEHQDRAAAAVAHENEELALRQELRARTDCARSMAGHNCTLAVRSPYFALKDGKNRLMGAAAGLGPGYRTFDEWTVRAYCQNGLMTAEAARVTARGAAKANRLRQHASTQNTDTWRVVLTSRELDCPAPPPPPGCKTGNVALCPRFVLGSVAPTAGGEYTGFAACAVGEMPYGCGFAAAGAYTTGPTSAYPGTRGGRPGCRCSIGHLDPTANGACPGGGCSPCTDPASTSPANGCGATCTALCVQAR